jgi:hypothetical protein
MTGIVAAAWTGLAEPEKWDFSPLGWAAVLLLAAWAAGIRFRWWLPVAAFGCGLPCATFAEHFGAVPIAAIIVVTALVLRPVIRAARS